MATTKAIIRTKRLNDKGETPIFIRYTHHQLSILISVGQKVDPLHWDDAGLVKRSMRGYSNINALIEKKKRVIDDLRIELLLADIDPTIERIKDVYQKKYKKGSYEVKISQYVLDHWDTFVEYQVKIKKIADGTSRQYRAAKTRIQVFEKENKTRLTFDSITSNFYDTFLYHMYSVRGCSPNSVGNQIKYMKAFMTWAVEKMKYTVNVAYKSFTKPKNPTQIFTLTKEQLDTFFYLDLSFDSRLERVRDMFCLCCTTGLRYSDVVRLDRANIKSDHIIISTKKTNDTAIIPLNDYSRAIVDKYPVKFPRISNQKMNNYLKQIGMIAKFEEEYEVITFRAGIKEVTKKPFFELLTMHMGRRTFITQSLERGMMPSSVMKLSTHKDHKSFSLYINTTKARLKHEVSEAWNTLDKNNSFKN